MFATAVYMDLTWIRASRIRWWGSSDSTCSECDRTQYLVNWKFLSEHSIFYDRLPTILELYPPWLGIILFSIKIERV